MVAAAVVIGLLGALGAVSFRLMIRTVQALFWEGSAGIDSLLSEGLLAEASDPFVVAQTTAWYWRIAIPAAGGLIAGPLIYFFAREARGHGVPEVMKAVAVRGGIIRPRVVAIKSLASALSIGTGGSVGREGPIIQIGAAVGSTLGQLLRVPTRQLRTLVGCGAAAGIAATFNAPIAGAIFAAELIVGDFAVAQFSSIVISSVVATVGSRFFLGNHPAFQVPVYEIVSPFEILPYMVAGMVAGVVGVAFIKTLHAAEDLFETLRFPEYLKAMIGGALVGVIGTSLPHVFGVGYTAIGLALAGKLAAGLLGALLIMKIVATSITIGSGGSGGIFAPSLFLGAMTGGFLGTFIHQWFPEATASSGAYALVTMGAVVAATTHAPISAILIIFELTQTINIIPALMAACVVSSLVSQLLSRDSIYTGKLHRQGIDIFEREDPNLLKGLFVRDVMDSAPEVIPASANFQTILDLVVQSAHTQFFVVSEKNELLGAISLSEVRRLIYEQDALRHLVVAGDLVDTRRPSVTPDNDLDLVLHLFSRSDVDELAVVDAADPRRLIGTVRDMAVIEARNREALRRDLAGGLTTSLTAVGQGRTVDLGDGYLVREILAPGRLIGHSLGELGIGKLTGVQVLLIRRARTRTGIQRAMQVPTAGEVLEEGDTLVVAGSLDAFERFERLERGR